MRPWRRPLCIAGLFAAGLVIWGAIEGPYVNWSSAAAPVDVQPMRIRHDAKGDGRWAAPRSGYRRHNGIDLAAPLGSPVRAIRSGRVLNVGTHKGLGRYVEIEHPQQWQSLYAHLQDVRVAAGQRVRQGASIGTVGKTGNARHAWIAPHLHLEVTRQGERINPLSLGLQALESSSVNGAAPPAEGNDDEG